MSDTPSVGVAEGGEAAAAPPPGFKRFPAERGFIGAIGPLWVRREDELFQLGFRVEARHCNPMGVCHGGMLATFADMLLSIGAICLVGELHRRFLPTVSLQVDYIASARLGDWVEGEVQVLRTTRSLVFAQGLVSSNRVMALRCSGVFKIGPQFDRSVLQAAQL